MKNTHKSVDRRLKALLMKAEGKKNREEVTATDYNRRYISELVGKYQKNGLSAITKTTRQRSGNLTREQEETFLGEFLQKAKDGQIVAISEMKRRYDDIIGFESAKSTIYKLMKRHGWRKVMPRSRQPKKATVEAIEGSKKSNSEPQN
jgi:transposase